MAHGKLFEEDGAVRFHVLLKRSHYDQLKELGRLDGLSVASIVRQIIAEFLRDPEEARQIATRRK